MKPINQCKTIKDLDEWAKEKKKRIDRFMLMNIEEYSEQLKNIENTYEKRRMKIK